MAFSFALSYTILLSYEAIVYTLMYVKFFPILMEGAERFSGVRA
jgi:hypothetical protein